MLMPDDTGQQPPSGHLQGHGTARHRAAASSFPGHHPYFHILLTASPGKGLGDPLTVLLRDDLFSQVSLIATRVRDEAGVRGHFLTRRKMLFGCGLRQEDEFTQVGQGERCLKLNGCKTQGK